MSRMSDAELMARASRLMARAIEAQGENELSRLNQQCPAYRDGTIVAEDHDFEAELERRRKFRATDAHQYDPSRPCISMLLTHPDKLFAEFRSKPTNSPAGLLALNNLEAFVSGTSAGRDRMLKIAASCLETLFAGGNVSAPGKVEIDNALKQMEQIADELLTQAGLKAAAK